MPIDNADRRTMLVVCASRTGSNAKLVDALVDGARSDGIDGVGVRVVAPLDAGLNDVVESDLVVLAAPPRLGMIAGLMKDFLERIYYPCQEAQVRKPCALVFKGDTDATGAHNDTNKILVGLKWTQVQPPLIVIGAIGEAELVAAHEYGATLAGGLSVGLW